MKIKFSKYQATGNDFIIIDDRENKFPKDDINLIKKLCDRRFGIGSDGLLLLQKSIDYDFKMWYANSDGRQSSMCGNGGRCISAFAKKIGLVESITKFEAIDGMHEAKFINGKNVELKMCDIEEVSQINNSIFETNSGSPHLVWFVNETEKYPVIETGRNIQSMPEYKGKGINVNFIEEQSIDSFAINIRTYERGVEDETLSCGTGATAASICLLKKNNIPNGNHVIKLQTMGGELQVKCEKKSDKSFQNIWLCGAAEFVFDGEIEV
jgi:diaminopimelate epimerase